MSAGDHRALILLIAGFTAWSFGFVLLYGLQALGCAYDWPAHRAILIAAYIVTLAPLAWLSLIKVRAEGEPASVLALSALWANRAALAAGVLTFFPVTFASACI